MQSRTVLTLFTAVAVTTIMGTAIWRRAARSRSDSALPPQSARLGKLLSHHCGIIAINAKTPVSITLSNELNKAVRLRNVDVTCGCLQLVECDKSIEPGGSGKLSLSFHPTTPGPARQRVSVITDSDDAARSIFQIELTANVQGGWSEPATLSYGRISTGAPVYRDVTVSLLGYPDVQLLQVSSDSPHIRAERAGEMESLPAEHGADGREKRFTQTFRVWCNESTPPGTLFARLRTRWLADAGEIDVVTPVTADVTGVWNCTPPQVVWIVDEAQGDEKLLRSEVRISTGKDPVDVSRMSVSCDLEVIATRILDSDSSSFTLEIARNDTPLERSGRTLQGSVVGEFDATTHFQIPVLIVFNRRAGATD